MPINYVVRQGDCLSSLADRFGFIPETIWDYPDNADLKETRESRNILFPGDIVVIPDRRIAAEACPTDAKYVFTRLAFREKLHIVLLDERDLPRSGLRYTLTVDGEIQEGTTGDDGSVEASIKPGARRGKLTVFQDELQEDYPLELGHLNPLTEESGVRMRLTNLGLDCGEDEDSLRQAILGFQQQRGLEATGEIDDQTREELKSVYGS